MYPQLTHVADKTFLAMIKKLKFVYDLEKPEVEDNFPTELSKIKEHYDSRTEKEELDAVKLLIDKINVPNLLNWQTPLYDVGRNGCIALHYYVHFLRIFSFVTRGTESEGVGARSVWTRLHLCNAQPARENVGIELRVISLYDTGLTHSTI